MERQHVTVAEERSLVRSGHVPVGARPRQRLLARPHKHAHPEAATVSGDDGADPAVAEDAECFSAQRVPDAHLPAARAQGRHLLGDLPHRGKHKPPRELGGRVGRRLGVHVRRHDDPEARAGVDVDMGVDAPLTDQSKLGQPLEQRRADRRPLPDQHERLAVTQPLGQHVDILDVIVPHRDLVLREPLEARQPAQRIEPVVEDRDVHAPMVSWDTATGSGAERVSGRARQARTTDQGGTRSDPRAERAVR